MGDPVEKARKLISLSSSSNEKEAKNAALQACRVIRKHGLVLSMPEPREEDEDGAVGVAPETDQVAFTNPPAPDLGELGSTLREKASAAAYDMFDTIGRAAVAAMGGKAARRRR